MPAKICPRCGNLYEDLKSKTCPNCFAVLEPIDRETAQAATRARAELEQTPEFQEIKAAEDERWREQSFRACLGVAAIFLATAVFAVVLLAVAAHRHARPHPAVPIARRVPTMDTPPGPAANAAIEDVMLARVGPFDRTLRETVPLTGVASPAFHATYVLHGDPLQTADAYAFPADRPAGEQNEFQAAVIFVARSEKPAQAPIPLTTAHWRYMLLGPSASRLAGALAGR